MTMLLEVIITYRSSLKCCTLFGNVLSPPPYNSDTVVPQLDVIFLSLPICATIGCDL